MTHKTAGRWFMRCIWTMLALIILQAFVEWSWAPLIPFDGARVHTHQGAILSALSVLPMLGAIVFGIAWVLLASSALEKRRA